MDLLFHPSESFDPAPGCNAAAWADGSGKPSVIDSRLLHSCNHQQVLGYSSGFRIPACGWVPSRGSFPCRWDIQPLLSVSLLFELHRWENRSAIQPESGIRKPEAGIRKPEGRWIAEWCEIQADGDEFELGIVAAWAELRSWWLTWRGRRGRRWRRGRCGPSREDSAAWAPCRRERRRRRRPFPIGP